MAHLNNVETQSNKSIENIFTKDNKLCYSMEESKYKKVFANVLYDDSTLSKYKVKLYHSFQVGDNNIYSYISIFNL